LDDSSRVNIRRSASYGKFAMPRDVVALLHECEKGQNGSRSQDSGET